MMIISPIDGGNYFRGLLLLIRKDHKIANAEFHLMKRIGKSLGFEHEYCENAVNDILDNKYISDITPKFSIKALAIMFIKDGLTLAFCDNEFHPAEEEWLRSTAQKNGLDSLWFCQEIINTVKKKEFSAHLEADDLIIKFS